MQISEQNLAAPQHLAFGSLRLLHFDDHVSASKYFLWRVDDLSPGIAIFVVRQARSDAGGFLNNDPVAAMRELRNRGGRQADTKFVVLDFLWCANQHSLSFGSVSNRHNPRQVFHWGSPGGRQDFILQAVARADYIVNPAVILKKSR